MLINRNINFELINYHEIYFMSITKEIKLNFSTNSTLNINYFNLQKEEYIHKLKNVEIIKDNI